MTAMPRIESTPAFRTMPRLSFNSVSEKNLVRTSIIIPVYNEEAALPHVLQDILAVVDSSFEVLVIDDGSRDRTREVAASFPCRVISHPVNRGKGAAMQTGIEQARGDNIIFIDGDATYPATAIPVVATMLNQFDMVRCVRDIGRDNIPLINRIGNGALDLLIKTVHRVEGTDLLSGLYGLQKHYLEAMNLESDGFDIETEIMVKSQSMKLRSQVMPIVYSERIGEKKLRPVRDGLRILSRTLSLAATYNPFVTYVVPGLVLWIVSLIVLALYPVMGLQSNSLLVGMMALLTGFQLMIFGCAVNVYVGETGIGRVSRSLSLVSTRFPRAYGSTAAAVLILIGIVWSGSLLSGWVGSGYGPFTHTDSLIMSLSMIVWGFQIFCTVVFLSLFSSVKRYAFKQERSRQMDRSTPRIYEGDRELVTVGISSLN